MIRVGSTHTLYGSCTNMAVVKLKLKMGQVRSQRGSRSSEHAEVKEGTDYVFD